MSSWFSSLQASATALTESAVKATEQAAKNMKLDQDMLQKLTLTTPELTAERQRIDQEERRKEAVKLQLANLLPWETRDAERDILVDECRDAILKLSHAPATFCGPFPMPETNVTLDGTPLPEREDGRLCGLGPEDTSERGGEDGDDDESAITEQKKAAAAPTTPKPSPESLEKLAKLQPLPVLLQEFDLDAHVGLIQRLLQVDKQLVKMHSSSELSGGGAREWTFWKNYFFHCAYSRYEAGLSVDEVWSEEAVQRNAQEQQQEAAEKAKQPTGLRAVTHSVMETMAQAAKAGGQKGDEEEDESEKAAAVEENQDNEISFEHNKDETTGSEEAEVTAASEANQQTAETKSNEGAAANPPAAPRESEPSPTNTSAEYDMVRDAAAAASTTTDNNKAASSNLADDDDDDVMVEDYEDPELDELEAEIARELED